MVFCFSPGSVLGDLANCLPSTLRAPGTHPVSAVLCCLWLVTSSHLLLSAQTAHSPPWGQSLARPCSLGSSPCSLKMTNEGASPLSSESQYLSYQHPLSWAFPTGTVLLLSPNKWDLSPPYHLGAHSVPCLRASVPFLMPVWQTAGTLPSRQFPAVPALPSRKLPRLQGNSILDPGSPLGGE